jgi:hypothetical protein
VRIGVPRVELGGPFEPAKRLDEVVAPIREWISYGPRRVPGARLIVLLESTGSAVERVLFYRFQPSWASRTSPSKSGV